MQTTDSIADYLNRIRNAMQSKHRIVEIPASNLKKRMTEILYDQGFIYRYTFEPVEGDQDTIKIAPKYNNDTGEPVIRKMGRISRPGLRKYSGNDEIPRIINGLGITIMTTSKGVMTGKNARKEGVGGEVLCYVY